MRFVRLNEDIGSIDSHTRASQPDSLDSHSRPSWDSNGGHSIIQSISKNIFTFDQTNSFLNSIGYVGRETTKQTYIDMTIIDT